MAEPMICGNCGKRDHLPLHCPELFLGTEETIRPVMEAAMKRVFETGASRDTDDGKFDYNGFLSPLVLERFAAYMHKNRFMKDGSIRASDNWQKGFGADHFGVCMSSLWRHFMDLWSLHRGYDAREDIDAAICGILFNTMAYYHQLLKDRRSEDLPKV